MEEEEIVEAPEEEVEQEGVEITDGEPTSA